MPATALPALVDLEGSGTAPDSATFRLAIGDVRRFLAGVLGTTGEVADALAALGLTVVAGDVLQMVTAAGSAGNTSSGTLATVSTPAAVTPRSAASKFLVECTFASRVLPYPGTEVGAGYQLFEGASSIGNVVYHYGDGLDGGTLLSVGSTCTMTLQAVVSNAALTARTFSLKANNRTTIIPIFYSEMLWKFTEIKT